MREFEPEGLRGGAPADEPSAGSAEIGSLTPLDCSCQTLRTLRTALGNERRDPQACGTRPDRLTITPLEQLPKLLFGMSFQGTSKGGRP